MDLVGRARVRIGYSQFSLTGISKYLVTIMAKSIERMPWIGIAQNGRNPFSLGGWSLLPGSHSSAFRGPWIIALR
jgi:hypothetical protein